MKRNNLPELLILVFSASCVGCEGIAWGAGCGRALGSSYQVAYSQPVSYVQPYVVKQNISYFVGAPVREQAYANYANEQVAIGQMTRELERLTSRLSELQQYQQQRQQMAYGYAQPQPMYQPPQQQQAYPQAQSGACQQCQGAPTAAPPQVFSRTQPGHDSQQLSDSGSVVSQTCMRCHSGAQPKGDFSFDGPLSREQKLRAMEQATSGAMPPEGEPLTEEEQFELFKELKLAQEMGQSTGDGGDDSSLPPPPPQQQGDLP